MTKLSDISGPMSNAQHTRIPFIKMHGLGNDFVIIDRRKTSFEIDAGMAEALGDRHRGIGFDQLAVIDPSVEVDARLSFYNQDGSLSAACGNATRCIARLLMQEGGSTILTLRTERGDLRCRDAGGGLTSVNMGAPFLRWDKVPLAREMDTLELPIDGSPTATGMGNPHCSFFVADVEAVDLQTFGAIHENHRLFPERTNVQIAHIAGPDHLRMRVWERGVGITLASGSSSCAVAVAAARRGLTGRAVRIDLDGGRIDVDWREDGVWMTGPTTHVADGVLATEFLRALG
jgi:diaminopimelate epimerase